MSTINTANAILHPSRLPEVRPPSLSSLFTSHFIPPLPKALPRSAQDTTSPALSTPPAEVVYEEQYPGVSSLGQMKEEGEGLSSSLPLTSLSLVSNPPAEVANEDQSQEMKDEGQTVSQQWFDMFEEPPDRVELPTSPSYAAIFDLSPPHPPSEELPPGYEESHQHDSISVGLSSHEESAEEQLVGNG